MDDMTDKQFDKILKMVSMILDGCKDLEEAKAKVKELLEEQKKEPYRIGKVQSKPDGVEDLPPKPLSDKRIIAIKSGKVNI